MTTQHTAQSEQAEVVLSEDQRKAFQEMAIAQGMSSDIRVIKGEVTNLVIGDAA